MAILDMLLKSRKWYLRNEDTGDELEGQFAPVNLTRDVKNNWAQHTALNRSRTIVQYLNSENDKISLQAGFYAAHSFDTANVEEKLETLISWAKRSQDLLRPPIVTFWVGDGHVEQTSVIDSISGITYGEPTALGAIREVSFTLNLLQYQEHSIEDTELFETRYHRTRERDYYELITQREYGSAIVGDVIRKQHPNQARLQSGNIVRLPSFPAIRTEKVEPKSLALKTSIGRRDTPQRALRQAVTERLNRSYISHVIVE